jgi:hypothetical protein
MSRSGKLLRALPPIKIFPKKEMPENLQLENFLRRNRNANFRNAIRKNIRHEEFADSKSLIPRWIAVLLRYENKKHSRRFQTKTLQPGKERESCPLPLSSGLLAAAASSDYLTSDSRQTHTIAWNAAPHGQTPGKSRNRTSGFWAISLLR